MEVSHISNVLLDESIYTNYSNHIPTIEESEKDKKEYDDLIDKFNKKAMQNVKLTDISSYQPNDFKIEIIRNNFFVEFAILFRRNWIMVARNKIALVVRLCMSVVNALLVLLIFFHLGNGNNAIID